MYKKIGYAILLLAWTLLCGGCGQHYVTPGGGVSMLEITDSDLVGYYETAPVAPFPANIAVVRVQDSGYRSRSHHGHGSGRYTIVTARDIEANDAFERLQDLSNVQGVAPIGRMLVPVNANSIKDLRVPAAKLHADMVLVYTVDTSFSVDGKPLGPLSLISLGLIPNKKAHVTATVAGMLVDVRSGYIYGTTESTDIQEQRATIWSTELAIDTARLTAERNAFEGFVGEFEELWAGVVDAYAVAGNSPHGSDVASAGYYSVRLGRELE